MLDVKTLQWDSDFFGLRIGQVKLSSNEDKEELWLMAHSLREQYDLLYVFCSKDVHIDMPNAVLVDEKVVYTKSIVECKEKSNEAKDISQYKEPIPNDDLYRLALLSGECSRFKKKDVLLPNDSYVRLYRRWIEQSTNRNMADKIFVWLNTKTQSAINGMCTLKIDYDCGVIGLIAVDIECQGKGIGKQLLSAAENYLLENTDVRTLNVVTQGNNVKARCLYERVGFAVKSVTNVYHWQP